MYPFGVDSAWHRADNGLLFFNSLKMKISVVFGVVQVRLCMAAAVAVTLRLCGCGCGSCALPAVTPSPQMSFGIILKMTNAVHFKSKLDLYFECLPQLLFMLSLFGYMLFLIFFKWSIDWNNPPEGAEGAPPSLVDTLIGIVLSPGSVVDAMYVQPQPPPCLLRRVCVPHSGRVVGAGSKARQLCRCFCCSSSSSAYPSCCTS